MAFRLFSRQIYVSNCVNVSTKLNVLKKSANQLACSRLISTSQTTCAASNQTTPSATAVPKKRDELDVHFNDPIAAFKSKTTMELLRAYFVYVLCSSEKLVEHNMKVC